MTQAASRTRSIPTLQGTLTIAWEIARDACTAAGIIEGEGPPPRLEVAIAISPALPRVELAHARLLDGSQTHEIRAASPASGACITDAETGITHIDIPGLLHISFRAEAPQRPLYARTALFETLRIRGGRYELLGGSFTTSAP